MHAKIRVGGKKNGKRKMFLNGGILGVFPTCSKKNNILMLVLLYIYIFYHKYTLDIGGTYRQEKR